VSLVQARQLSELLDFAEQERQMLLEKEASLQQELEQVGHMGRTGLGRGLLQATGTGAFTRYQQNQYSCHLIFSRSHAKWSRRCATAGLLCFCCADVLQLRSRAIAAESGASDALAESAVVEQQLDATKRKVRPVLLVMNRLEQQQQQLPP
jgi:hypothetical protein